MDEIIKERMVRNLKQAIGDHWGYEDNGDEVLRKMYLSDLNAKSLPDEYIGEDILKEIEDKFYFFLGAVRDELPEFIEIYVMPSYEDATTYFMILDDKLLYKDYQKAWNFWFESEEELMDEMYSIYRRLLEKLEKAYECYTLMDADIQAVADHKGLSLDGIDLDDVVDYIKKGIAWGLDDVRDQIIEEAITQATNTGDQIYIGDLGEAKVTEHGIDAHYIEETDGTKSWQLHPDESRGDTVLKSVKVTPLEPLERV